MTRYKIIHQKPYGSYYVMYKAKWWHSWKYVMRHGEKTLIRYWDTYRGAQTYINQQQLQMADITMCSNEDCYLRKECYRFTATPKTNQSYQPMAPNEEGICDFFWSNNKQQDGRTIDESKS